MTYTNKSLQYNHSPRGCGAVKRCNTPRYTPHHFTKRAKKRKKRFLLIRTACVIFILTVFITLIRQFSSASYPLLPQPDYIPPSGKNNTLSISGEELPKEMKKLLELNEEAADYVNNYWNRDAYKTCAIDLTNDFVSGQVPLLMQWDKRWGYNDYGDSFIGLAGCGPVCLNMTYLYFTEDTDITPREMSEFAYANGYYTSAGTSWSLWTEGAEKLGLKGSELPLDESRMCQALDAGSLIVCSMGPGDFTTTGHFILIRGYDENGFYVNDPNRRSNSEKQWDFATLQHQIRNLWALSG